MTLEYWIIVACLIVFTLVISAYEEAAKDLKEANEKKLNEKKKPDQDHEIEQPDQARFSVLPDNWVLSDYEQKEMSRLADEIGGKPQNQSSEIRQSKVRKYY